MFKKMKASQRDTLFATLCILPAFAGIAIVVLAPILKAIWMSFTSYKITSTAAPIWNNFDNYIKLFSSGQVTQYLINTIVFIFFVVVVQFILAMMMAMLLNARHIHGRNALRAAFMIPWTIPSVVTALLWSWLLQPQYGVLNWLFYNLGLQGQLNQLWVQDPVLAMPAIIIACVWRQTPYMMVMLLAGLQSVPYDLLEAASIDGAGGVKKFIHVMLPSIRPVIDTSIVVAIINNSQMFAIIYNMTAGGPISKTTTFSVAAYIKAFVSFDFGQGSALGVIWLVVLSIFVFFYKRYSDRKVSAYM